MSSKNKGQILAEILVALGIISIIIIAVYQLFAVTSQGKEFASRETQATALLQEQLEALKSIREQGWEKLAPGLYYPTINGAIWNPKPIQSPEEAEQIGDYKRYLKIEKVYRDEAGNIAQEGIEDKSTYQVNSYVSWQKPRERTISATTFLTRFRDNLTWVQTTKADFDAGVLQYTETTQVYDGEVQLQGGCQANPQGPWIFDDAFQNTWDIHPSGRNDIKLVNRQQGQVYQGEKALAIVNFHGADSKLRNGENICTIGFSRIEFYAYNSASIEQSFQIGGNWIGKFKEITLSPQSWQLVSIPYEEISGNNEENLNFIFLKPGNYQPDTIFYLDNMTLSGGVGGYFQVGTLTSSIFDAGSSSSFNRIEFSAQTPQNTEVGFQAAASDNPDGPWEFVGPQGTSLDTDLYKNPTGEGIFFGKNIGRYFRYKAFLKSFDGKNTPVLEDVTVNYSP